MNPVKGCNMEHTVLGYSLPLFYYILLLHLMYMYM